MNTLAFDRNMCETKSCFYLKDRQLRGYPFHQVRESPKNKNCETYGTSLLARILFLAEQLAKGNVKDSFSHRKLEANKKMKVLFAQFVIYGKIIEHIKH